ncbi:MAG: hypothetical protein HRT61_23205, partial [Ekhidna sp.]|nr:hypothetical protein [Ekhidna sp.]
MKRRVFVSQSVKLISASFLIGGVTACKDEEVSSNEPDCEAAGTKSSIADNHGHTLSVSKRDVIEGRTKGYEIQGSSGHTHTVVLGS